MKNILTHSYTKYSALIALLASLAATNGSFSWSDANLKQEIEPLQGALAKLQTIRTA